MKLKLLNSFLVFLVSPVLAFDNSSATVQTSDCGSGKSWYLTRVATPVFARQFAAACDEHDACYDTYGKSKQECDRAFHNRTLGICGRDHNTWLERPLKIACNGRADAFYTAVLEFGQKPYNEAQKAAKPSFSWSQAGAISGLTCTRIYEDADPHAWSDNYLCSNKNWGLRWSQANAIGGMKCTRIYEDADPHAWADNYLCW
jgi:Group XII secretory phospholipase A2 precursor (PLA2G12)